MAEEFFIIENLNLASTRKKNHGLEALRAWNVLNCLKMCLYHEIKFFLGIEAVRVSSFSALTKSLMHYN